MINSEDIDNTSVSSEEDALDIAKKDWSRVISAANKAGYRDGIEDGSESVFQEGFDRGYEDGFKTAFVLGKFKSLMNASDEKHSVDIKQILDKTRRGACNICKLETQHQKEDIDKMTLSEIIGKQNIHSAEIIEKLRIHFQPIIEQFNINMSDSRG